MSYSDTRAKDRYEGGVKAARHRPPRSIIVDVFLMQETNEVDHLNADGNVVLTQPGRGASVTSLRTRPKMAAQF
jgi:hypothetical protein